MPIEPRFGAGFAYAAGQLNCEGRPLAGLADEYGTPLYVYSARAVRGNYRRLAAAFAPLDPLICYAVKANANLALLRLLLAEGAGVDIVSGGELHCALRAGADPARIVFAGVGKTDRELGEALAARVGWHNVESADELRRLNALAAARGGRATVALRLNPGVEPDTHDHIRTGGAASKFGLPVAEALELASRPADLPGLHLKGVHVHIGSQMAGPEPLLRALDAALAFIESVPTVEVLDLGGGFPVPYAEADAFPEIEAFAAPVVARLRPWLGRLRFHIEPGRYLIANAGALVTTVQAVKTMAGRRLAVVDAGMNALLRPALYAAHHRVLPLESGGEPRTPADVVGPICESADVLARGRDLPPLRPGDRLALMDAGAYGYSMASHYNMQPRPAEVLVEAGAARLIRRRESYEDLTRLDEA